MELHEPVITNKEIQYIKDCLKRNELTNGKFVNRFENKIKSFVKTKYAVSMNSCTSALHLSLKLIGATNKTEILVPTITFVASVNAIIYNNADPVFMDVDKYLNIDVDKTINFIKNETNYNRGFTYNKKTKNKIVGILLVHTFGNSCNFKELLKVCKERNIEIVEDSAESLGSYYKFSKSKFKHTGTIGKIGCFSFNGNKIITSSGGGMIVTNSSKIYLLAKHYANQAKTNNLKFFHDDIGYNYRLSNIHAAIGCAQMENLKNILKRKRWIYKSYKDILGKSSGIKLLESPKYSISNYWLNIVHLDSKLMKSRTANIVKNFKKNKINIRYVWYPNHLQKPFKKYQSYKISMKKEFFENLICLPSSPNLKINQIIQISKLLNE